MKGGLGESGKGREGKEKIVEKEWKSDNMRNFGGREKEEMKRDGRNGEKVKEEKVVSERRKKEKDGKIKKMSKGRDVEKINLERKG